MMIDAAQGRSISPHGPERLDLPSEKPVDLDHLRRYTLGDKALEDEVLGLFLAQLPEAIASLKSAANPRDWKIAAHGLKGSSRAVGAWRIATLAQEAEALAAVRETEECRETISRLEAAVSEASNFVRAFAERR
ncbi:Hpt domain-containing protein [Hyphomicrobium sp.]|uniref:Hpt domain-containing protein n=1 Tax=Hyphomicrobium sp. TaxID=82 RepID=UPI0025C2340B|nr:Hpt domain-containing protein [Hyphomicrobium sp.]